MYDQYHCRYHYYHHYHYSGQRSRAPTSPQLRISRLKSHVTIYFKLCILLLLLLLFINYMIICFIHHGGCRRKATGVRDERGSTTESIDCETEPNRCRAMDGVGFRVLGASPSRVKPNPETLLLTQCKSHHGRLHVYVHQGTEPGYKPC